MYGGGAAFQLYHKLGQAGWESDPGDDGWICGLQESDLKQIVRETYKNNCKVGP